MSTLARCPKHGRIYDSAKTHCPACIAESGGTNPPPQRPPPKQGLPRPVLAGILVIIVLAFAGPKLLKVAGDGFRSLSDKVKVKPLRSRAQREMDRIDSLVSPSQAQMQRQTQFQARQESMIARLYSPYMSSTESTAARLRREAASRDSAFHRQAQSMSRRRDSSLKALTQQVRSGRRP